MVNSKNVMILILLIAVFGLMGIFMYGLNKYNKHDYDEMQEIVRGKAYKCAFISLLTICGVYALYDLFAAENLLRLSAGLVAMILFFIGLSVFSIYCITHDAYFYVGAKNRLKNSCILNIVVCIVCFISLSIHPMGDYFQIKDGIISVNGFHSFYIAFMIVYVIDTIAIFLKILQENKLETLEE